MKFENIKSIQKKFKQRVKTLNSNNIYVIRYIKLFVFTFLCENRRII